MKKLIVFLTLSIVSSTSYAMNKVLSKYKFILLANRGQMVKFSDALFNESILRSYHDSGDGTKEFWDYLNLLKKQKEVLKNLDEKNNVNNQEKVLEQFDKFQHIQKLTTHLYHLEKMVFHEKSRQSQAYNRLLASSCLMEYAFQLDIDKNKRDMLLRLGSHSHMHAREEYDEASVYVKEKQAEIVNIKKKLGWNSQDIDIKDKEE